LTLGFLGILTLEAGIATGAVVLQGWLDSPPWSIFVITLLVGIPSGAWLISKLTKPLDRTLEDLSHGILSFQDRDFSVRLASDRRDELGDLARFYNRVAATLLKERLEVRERELLLQTALNQSPAAIVLVNSMDRVIYSNREARRLLLGGAKLEGHQFDEIRQGCPPQMREVLSGDGDGIFSVQNEDNLETYHLSERTFLLNRRRHSLILLRIMTGELGRQEAEIWKKVIRVISHELNNSMAPISSLIHSAQVATEDPRHTHQKEKIFSSIDERLDHLKRFIEGYARFARLPQPRREPVAWPEFVQSLGEYPNLTIVGRLPATPGYFDPAQMRQALVNLLKNAVESSIDSPRISLRVKDVGADGTYIQVTDQGSGMDEETMKKALLPFYSTKKTGTGLGLPLCREILEAHGGKLSLQAQPEGGMAVTCWLPPYPRKEPHAQQTG
jgi:signal transduction histidine kinase